jgi:glycosyltransferase involved in cell wall biosynthesis
MNQPLVSVIVPTKNSEEFLGKCLDSIKNQTYKDVEIIVVDNNSIDKTKEIAQKYTDKVFNCGPERSAQRNYGAEESKGEYVYFVDSDFILDKDVMRQCVDKIEKKYDAIVVHNSPDISVSWIAKVRKFEVDMYKYDLTHSAARFFKRKVFLVIGGYNKKITAGEDYDIQNKLNNKGYRTGFIGPEAVHLGEPKSFWKHMKKYYNYGKDFTKFKTENQKESKKQLGFFRKVYFKNWKKFLKHPILGLEFISYHFFKFFCGLIGYLINRIKG